MITTGVPSTLSKSIGSKLINQRNINSGSAESELIRLAASAESGSEHPLSDAILAEAEKRNLELSQPAAFRAISGNGIEAQVDGFDLLVGNLRLITENQLELNGLEKEIERIQNESKTAVLVGVNGNVFGVLAIADTVKKGSKAAVQQLHNMDIETVIVTGDNTLTAQSIANHVGVGAVFAEILPGEKADNLATAFFDLEETNVWDIVPYAGLSRKYSRADEQGDMLVEQLGFDEEQAALQGWYDCSYGACHDPAGTAAQYGSQYPTIGGPMPDTPLVDAYSIAQAKKANVIQSILLGRIMNMGGLSLKGVTSRVVTPYYDLFFVVYWIRRS